MASFTDTKWDIQYAPNEDEKETRTIGIEFECKVTNLNSAYHNQSVSAANQRYRREHPGSWPCDQEISNEPKEVFPIAAWGYDGGGKEFVTHPDSITFFKKGGSKRLKKVVKYLAKNTEADKASGTHIHVSELKKDNRQKTWDNLYWCMCGFGMQMQKIFGRSSHWTRPPEISKILNADYNMCTPNVFSISYDKPKNMKKIDTSRYETKHTMINLHRGGTYEFRGPKASHDLGEILAWVEFCHNMVEICATTDDITQVAFREFLKGRHIAKYVRSLAKNKYRCITTAERGRTIGKAVKFSYYNTNKVF